MKTGLSHNWFYVILPLDGLPLKGGSLHKTKLCVKRPRTPYPILEKSGKDVTRPGPVWIRQGINVKLSRRRNVQSVVHFIAAQLYDRKHDRQRQSLSHRFFPTEKMSNIDSFSKSIAISVPFANVIYRNRRFTGLTVNTVVFWWARIRHITQFTNAKARTRALWKQDRIAWFGILFF